MTTLSSNFSWFQAWFQERSSEFSGHLLWNEPLSKHTYYRIGGPARIFAVPKSSKDVKWLFRGIQETGIPFFILGNGSNLLVADQGFDGLIISTRRLNLEIAALGSGQISLDPSSPSQTSQTPEDKLRIRTGASVAISTLLRKAAQEGWAGLEFLTGIPGTVGGVVTMNGGTHLGDTAQCLRQVEAYTWDHLAANQPRTPSPGGQVPVLKTFKGSQLQFQYRKNLFLPRGSLILSAEWDVLREDPKKVKSTIDEVLARRKSTQPLDYPSCGSVFKNPKASGLSAWAVIDRLGLRGYRVGGAGFSEKHSNFILNLDNAKASDIRSLIETAKSRALDEMGIELEEEVIYLGF